MNSSKEIDITKIKEAFASFYDLAELSLIEHTYEKEGKVVVSKIVKNTVVYFLTYFILTLITIFLVNCFERGNTSLWVLGIFIVFYILIPRFVTYFRFSAFKSLINNNDVIFTSTGRIDKTSKFKPRISINLFFSIKQFSFKTLWIWVMVIGFIKALTDVSFFENAHNYETIIKFSEQFIVSLLLVIITYIATNILGELISVRDDYSKQKDLLDQLTGSMPNLDNTVNKAIGSISDFSTILDTQQGFSNLTQKIRNEREYGKDSFELIEILEQYSSTIKEQFNLTQKKLIKDSYIDSWLISCFNAAANQRIENLNTTDVLVTDFSIFSKILQIGLDESQKFIKDELKVEIYTILVIKPDEFVNYALTLEDTLLSDEEKQLKIKEWDKFLEKNKTIASQEQSITINRHFLSHNFNLTYNPFKNNKEIGPLKLDNVLQSLDGSYNEKTIKHWVDNVYHKTNKAKILHIPKWQEDENSTALSWLFPKVSGKAKPIDLFCIRTRKSDEDWEWRLCLKTLYDRDLSMAKITMLHDSVADKTKNIWEETKKNLNEVFLLDVFEADGIKFKNGIEIVTLNNTDKLTI